MKIKQTVLIIMTLIGLGSIFVIVPAASAAKCAGVETALISCKSEPKDVKTVDETGIWYLLLLAINILSAGIGVAAIAGIVVGSVMYTTAGGKPEQVKKANIILGNTVLGIVAYALMYAFLNFIIPGGLF